MLLKQRNIYSQGFQMRKIYFDHRTGRIFIKIYQDILINSITNSRAQISHISRSFTTKFQG